MFKISLPPGIFKSETRHGLPGHWVDGDKVRFVAGKAEKIGGWDKLIEDPTTGLVRGLFGWVTEDGNRILTLGTSHKLYAVTDEYDDITPLRDSGTLANDPFAVVLDSTTVTVTDAAHGLEVGAYVVFDGATAGGGITIDGEYTVTTVIDAGSYTITHSSAATSTDATTGGAAVAYEYEINPGLSSSVFGTGYGSGDYGEEDYGDERAGFAGIELELRVWFIQKYGVNIVVAPSGGTLYEWDQAGAADRAEAIANAPSAMRAMFVTAEGFVFALGTTTPMTLAWPDRDDITDWTPTLTNTANIRILQKGNKLVAGAALSDLNLIWSDTACYLAQFLPGDTAIIYDTRLASENAGLIGPMAYTIAGEPALAFWMSNANFLMFDGGVVRHIPNQMAIRDYVYRNMDRSRTSKYWAGYNAKKGEVWFGYVRDGDSEPGHYAMVNLQDFSWSIGTLTRTGMTYMPIPTTDVIMTGTDSYIYEHEVGVNADGAAMTSYIASGLMDISEGEEDMDIVRYVHDFERHTGVLVLEVETYERPQSVTALDEIELQIDQGDDENDDYMIGGRHAAVTWTSAVLDGDYRMGTSMFEIQPAGQR